MKAHDLDPSVTAEGLKAAQAGPSPPFPLLAEQDDEWQDGRRYFSPESMALIDSTVPREEGLPLLLAS